MEHDTSKTVVEQVKELMKLPQHHCKIRGNCCKVATFKGGLSYDEIQQLIQDPNTPESQREGAKDFLSIFVPYATEEEAVQVAPGFVQRVYDHFEGKDSISFFYCQYLDKSMCGIHEDRPQLCRMYPIPHEKTIYHPGCGFEKIGMEHARQINGLLNSIEAKKHFQEGNDYYDNGDFLNAIMYFKLSIEKDPTFESALINLGLSYHKTGQFQQAVESLKQAVKLNQNASTTFYIANICMEQGNLEEAEAFYKETVTLDPRNAFAYLKLSRLASLKEDFDAMKQYMQKAYELNPDMFKSV